MKEVNINIFECEDYNKPIPKDAEPCHIILEDGKGWRAIPLNKEVLGWIYHTKNNRFLISLENKKHNSKRSK